MLSFIIFIFIIIFIFNLASSNNIKRYFSMYSRYLSNVELLYSEGSILLYTADKSGENFIFAVKNDATPITTKEVTLLYEKAEKYHIHNRILITDTPIDTSSPVYRKLVEYRLDVWNSSKLRELINSEVRSGTVMATASALKTSDTSNDTCDIEEEANDPIQDGTLHTHGIFSFLGNKPDKL